MYDLRIFFFESETIPKDTTPLLHIQGPVPIDQSRPEESPRPLVPTWSHFQSMPKTIIDIPVFGISFHCWKTLISHLLLSTIFCLLSSQPYSLIPSCANRPYGIFLKGISPPRIPFIQISVDISSGKRSKVWNSKAFQSG